MTRIASPFVCLIAFAASAFAADPIDIGSRRELFVDRHLIEHLDNVRLELHGPEPREVAVVRDQPWEGNTCFYHSVFRDGDLYRMYYRGSQHPAGGGATHQVVCYAESRDGVAWTKPDLGLVEFNGSKENNSIWDGVGRHNFVPFRDTNPDCTQEARYKAIAGSKHEGATRGCYVDYHRKGRNGKRDIMTCTSPDFLDWTAPKFLAYPGAPSEHLYVNQIQPYYRAPHIYVGFPKRFVPSRRSPIDHPLPEVSDTILMSSRDGETFHRWQQAFVRAGLQPDRWVCRNNLVAWGLVETGSSLEGAPDEMSLYVVEGYYQGDSCRVRRHTLRVDGIVSATADLKGGTLLTKPLTFDGPQLELNFATSAAGSIRVEIQRDDGKPIDGFTLADCAEIFGDTTARSVVWKDSSSVAALAGKPVRLLFELKGADLYSWRFAANE